MDNPLTISTRRRATAIGFVAVLLWSLLALFTVGSGSTPPFQLNAMCFALGAALGFGWMAATGAPLALLRQPAPVWALGVLGLFGYHFFYFTALRNAPPAEAGLIAYLWPLLIVLFSGLLPGERLRPLHVVGALAAFAGAAMIVTGGGAVEFTATHGLGFAAAAACALIWSGYSVLSRKVGHAPTATVAGFCLATAILSLICHLAWEQTIWPASATEWAAVAALGVGPVGLAFYVWDIGVKRGDIQLLGVASYAAPLLSTLALVAAGYAEPSATLIAAATLIAGGAGVAALASRGLSSRA
jgi:drug/metabolite transporter (DMT)-like permease